MGKSMLAGHFPRTGFIIGSQEQGVRYLTATRQIPPPVWIDEYDTDSPLSFDKVCERINKAALDKNISTIVIETLTDFQAMAFTKGCKEDYKGDFSKDGFFAYGQGPKNTATFIWPNLIEALNNAAGNGKGVILTAHARAKQHTDPTGVKYLKYFPYADEEIWQRAHKWASGVFLIAMRVQEDSDKNKGSLKRVAKDSNQRLLYVGTTPYAAVKNWYGFSKDVIDLGDSGKEGYNNLVKAFTEVGQ